MVGDPNFRRSVVLVVEDEPEEGTLGVVLNRPTETPVGQLLESWTGLVTGPSVVFRGGPVSPNSALGLAIVPGEDEPVGWRALDGMTDRKSTRLNSSHMSISYAVFCLKKKNETPGNAPTSVHKEKFIFSGV